jgi:hypothetical protein
MRIPRKLNRQNEARNPLCSLFSIQSQFPKLNVPQTAAVPIPNGLNGGVHPKSVCPNCARDMRFWHFCHVWHNAESVTYERSIKG